MSLQKESSFWSRFRDINFVVGGSYSLWYYLFHEAEQGRGKAQQWKPSDVDVFTELRNPERLSVKTLIDEFKPWLDRCGTGCELVRITPNQFYDWHNLSIDKQMPLKADIKHSLAEPEEDFHASIVAVATLNVPENTFGADIAFGPRDKVKMQLVLLDRRVPLYGGERATDLWSLFVAISDLGVFFSYVGSASGKQKIWFATEQIRVDPMCLPNLCWKRMDKYKARGFRF